MPPAHTRRQLRRQQTHSLPDLLPPRWGLEIFSL